MCNSSKDPINLFIEHYFIKTIDHTIMTKYKKIQQTEKKTNVITENLVINASLSQKLTHPICCTTDSCD